MEIIQGKLAIMQCFLVAIHFNDMEKLYEKWIFQCKSELLLKIHENIVQMNIFQASLYTEWNFCVVFHLTNVKAIFTNSLSFLQKKLWERLIDAFLHQCLFQQFVCILVMFHISHRHKN